MSIHLWVLYETLSLNLLTRSQPIISCSKTQVDSNLSLLNEFYSAALCEDPVTIDNGMVTFNDNSVGAMATYTCDSGFELIGNATTTCTLVNMNSADFQPTPPSCRREY